MANTLSGQIGFLFKKDKVTSVKGTAVTACRKAGVVEVKNEKGEITETLQTKNILICTGARNREIPTLKPDGKNIITSREAMILPAIPKKLVIIRARAIGVEFAYIYEAVRHRDHAD